ncbi:MAG: Fpg/Nei family DNA glycosylase [Nostocoides sp.]
MPEGHTLYRIARDLQAAFAATIPQVSSPQGRFAVGAAQLDGREVLGVTSRGKHLFVEFAGDHWLHVHLGLIGTFTIDAAPYAGELLVVGQVRLRLATQDHVADLRGPTVCEVVTPDKVDEVLSRLGPDPLRVSEADVPGWAGDVDLQDPRRAWRRIERSGNSIAELLMNQAVVAGVGNVYRSEVLYRLRLNPHTLGRELRPASWQAIWSDLVRLLPLGVATGRIVTVPEQVEEVEADLAAGREITLDERTSAVYKRAGQPCLRDDARIRTEVMAGRNLFWCPRCQRRH